MIKIKFSKKDNDYRFYVNRKRITYYHSFHYSHFRQQLLITEGWSDESITTRVYND